MTDECPHCGASQRGEPVAPEHRHCHFVPGEEDDGRPLHYSHTIAVKIQGEHDGVLFSQCPFCHGRWHRWTKQDWPRLYATAQRYINGRGYHDGRPRTSPTEENPQ